jgi:hypothetical protein
VWGRGYMIREPSASHVSVSSESVSQLTAA